MDTKTLTQIKSARVPERGDFPSEQQDFTKPSQCKTIREILNRYSRGEFVSHITDILEPESKDLDYVEDYQNPLEQRQRVSDYLDDLKHRSQSPETAQISVENGEEVQTPSESNDGSKEPSN